jgi:hypothetical protein
MCSSPANKEELYNLRHAQARNVIEHLFGVLKRCWAILTRAPQYDMSIQARVPPGLAALRNFIMTHNPADIKEYLTDPNLVDPQPGTQGILAEGYVERAERECATEARDDIAQAMWDQYQQYLREHHVTLKILHFLDSFLLYPLLHIVIMSTIESGSSITP